MSDPTTPAELYDYLQRAFGIGDWDEATADGLPWWKFRGQQIAKLKAMLRKRRATVEQVVIAARYAREHRTPVREHYQLFALIPEAMREQRRQAKEAAQRVWHDDLERAIDEAIEAGETGWADRLMRASGADAVTALNEWRHR